jgi:23S rRNA pseudouridine1911/1915/1917 synthase
MNDYAILYEDAEILVADKLAPLPVQPEKSGDLSLQELLRRELGTRDGSGRGIFLEAAHRIDRRASGALLFAKTRKALSTMEAAFRDRRVSKTYLACVEHEPEPASGRLEHELVWDKRRNLVRALHTSRPEEVSPRGGGRGEGNMPNDRTAVLEYRLVGRSERYFFLEIGLVTGRHHQIRAQLSAFGCPIRGDLKYGARRSAPNGLIMLHARRIDSLRPAEDRRADRPDRALPSLRGAVDGSSAKLGERIGDVARRRDLAYMMDMDLRASRGRKPGSFASPDTRETKMSMKATFSRKVSLVR